MDKDKIIIKALECIHDWIDTREREPDKAMIYRSMLKGCVENLKEEIKKGEENENS